MEFLVLGPVTVRQDGTTVDVGGRRQRAVLARLLAAHGSVVAADRILDDLWSGEPTPSAMGGLQAYISNLRKAIEPDRSPRSAATVLIRRAPGYALDGRTDADDFEDLVDAGVRDLRRGDATAAAATLADALGLWRGEAYADLADEPWLGAEITRLNELRLVAREHRLAAEVSVGHTHAAIPELEALVVEHPLREGFWRLLALALYRTGRQADALEALRRARATLADELGLDPSPELRSLEADVLAQAAELGSAPVNIPDSAPAVSLEAALDITPEPESVVGRDEPRTVLRSAASAAEQSRPQVVVISGEPGIGKTWLAEAFTDELAAAGWRVAWGRCHDTSGSPALWPWRQIFDHLNEARGNDDEVDAAFAGVQPASGPDARFRQHEALRHALLRVADDRPLAIAIDDVQWADAASLQLLADVIEQTRSGRLLLLVTTRPTEEGRIADALVRLDRVGAHRVPLAGLQEADVAELVAAGGLALDVGEVTRRTGGNPFFVRETLRLVSRSGPDTGLSTVPDSVGDLVRQQTARMPAEAQTALQAAAVLGRDVDADLLTEVSGQAPDEVWDALDAAVLVGVLVDAADGRLRFAHDLVRETLYGDLAPLRRSRLHARVVDVLEERGSIDVTAMAEHAQAAGPAARSAACRWTVAAAEQATTGLAYDDAARWWEAAVRAHDLHGGLPGGDRVRLLLSLVHAQLNAGAAIQARETRNEAVLAADHVDPDSEPDLRALALVALDAPALWVLRGYGEVALDIVGRLERELAARSPEDDPLTCRLLATLAAEEYGLEAEPLSGPANQAVAMARRIGDPRLQVAALNARLHSWTTAGHAGEMRTDATEILTLAEQHNLPEFALLAHQSTAWALQQAFDIPGSDDAAARADRLLRRLNLTVPRLQQHTIRMGRLLLDARVEEAALLVDSIAESASQWWASDGLLAAQRVFIGLVAEDWDTVEALLPTVTHVHPSLAHDAQFLVDAARGAAASSGPIEWPDIPDDWAWFSLTMVRADAALVVGHAPTIRASYDALAPHAGLVGVGSGFATPVDWYLARLARALGDHEAADAHTARLLAAAASADLDSWPERVRAAGLVAS